MGTYVTLGFALAMLALGVSLYNRLVTLHKRYRNAFAQIDVQLKQRYDLIPNLVEVAKGHLQPERAAPSLRSTEWVTNLGLRREAPAAKASQTRYPLSP